MGYKDRSTILRLLGGLMLIVGIGAGLLGPIELYVFYLFSEGGPFYYKGFGFGSFMFGNMALQIMGYYVIALILIPLGYGHLQVRRWARTFAVTLIWSWLVVGVPLVLVFLFILLSAKDLSLAAALLAAALAALGYLLLPWLLIRFYNGANVRRTFETRDRNITWIERVPVPNLVLAFLCLFYAVVLHIPILFNGLFPLFGTWLSGLPGIIALTASIATLVLLAWGVVHQRLWAWWGSLAYFTLLTVSTLVTLLTSSYAEILAAMDFPPFELDILSGMPLQGYHFAVLVGIPLLLALAAILLARRHFGRGLRATPGTPAAIRRATVADFDGVGAVFAEENRFHAALVPHAIRVAEPVMTRAWFEGVLADPKQALFVAQIGEDIAGVLLAALKASADDPILQPRRYACVDEIAVLERYRGHGIGRALMAEAERWTLQQGASEIELHVWEANRQAIGFYEGFGYATTRRTMRRVPGSAQ